ncbi:acyltransferase family protein [Tunturiibacter gelidoferens]|uniref:Peptidoglycan/LPS O-acetylase OafA/YrhL n=3 Tax=Tunturiibacter TaxID=3154218 RepID=A0A7Y9NIZ5_9BACT|nr:acyltransferase [Edaphobacter lichenicola]MBB5340579.1 peptidoglycan/LPS O-acetylase OafA/YrhL [Edaphobacter lichenicola]NYF50107.1 peptidoglycan/LPS O-acetylase OafA/YrhL [Edaphobacter lichenicola]
MPIPVPTLIGEPAPSTPVAKAASTMKKNDSIQILRAVAALLVVHVHAIFSVSHHAIPAETRFFNLSGVGACGVDIFFAISGFILSTVAMNIRPKSSSAHSALDFLFRRFIRIFPIYWTLSLFFVLVDLKQHHLVLSSLVNSYLLVPSLHFPIPPPLIFVGWTLIFEMFFYYIITLNLFFGAGRVVERTILTIFVLIALGSIIGLQRPVVILLANPINLEFVLGCLIGLLFARYGKRHALGTVLLFAGTIPLVLSTFFNKYDIEANNVLNGSLSWHRLLIWGIPAAMVTAGLVFRSSQIRSPLGRFGVQLGDASYSIYLVSLPVFYVYERFYPHLASLGADPNVLLSTLLVAVAGLLCYRLIEKPMLHFITAKYHHPAVQSAP